MPLLSPLAGTFYAAPSSDEPAFVRVGDKVALVDAVCIIDIMKVMNNVMSPATGSVCRIDVINAESISAGQASLWIEPDDGAS